MAVTAQQQPEGNSSSHSGTELHHHTSSPHTPPPPPLPPLFVDHIRCHGVQLPYSGKLSLGANFLRFSWTDMLPQKQTAKNKLRWKWSLYKCPSKLQ